MSIQFDIKKDKNVTMLVEMSGIKQDKLEITFNIDVDGVIYGFPCSINENKVNMNIPALNTIIKNIKPGKYRGTIDVVLPGEYHLRPFDEDIEIVKCETPDVKIKKSIVKEEKPSVSIFLDEEDKIKKKSKQKRIVDKIEKQESIGEMKSFLDNLFDNTEIKDNDSDDSNEETEE